MSGPPTNQGETPYPQFGGSQQNQQQQWYDLPQPYQPAPYHPPGSFQQPHHQQHQQYQQQQQGSHTAKKNPKNKKRKPCLNCGETSHPLKRCDRPPKDGKPYLQGCGNCEGSHITDNCPKPWPPKGSSEHHVMVECRDGLYQFESLIDIRTQPGFWENEHRPDTEERTKEKIEQGFYNRNIGKKLPTEEDKHRERDPAWSDPAALATKYPIGSMVPEFTRSFQRFDESAARSRRYKANDSTASASQPTANSLEPNLYQPPVPLVQAPHQHQQQVQSQDSQALLDVLAKAIDLVGNEKARLMEIMAEAIARGFTSHKRPRPAPANADTRQRGVKKQKQEQSEHVRLDKWNDSHSQFKYGAINDAREDRIQVKPETSTVVKREENHSIPFASDDVKVKIESIEDDIGCSFGSSERMKRVESRRAALERRTVDRSAPHSSSSEGTALNTVPLPSIIKTESVRSDMGGNGQKGREQEKGNSGGKHVRGYQNERWDRGGR
ncbi:hypothetical protein GLAREA_06586 [Glarea lozoyensis ATCC 20868]|uniref:CCHC-type domain-containing protein n=1 Tax=Glarea lozoyensis (strain ATCC 20868 / MF5171) TaxID=1116229 RepID=S3E586_GLAL2|nr:uncharacterized protein GLAREA_06586 [Glarea lozoyensis ATCC 20868]EPE33573.1 hypothetical protein GLAREA_06586 [Glarea lozoyensis ATCC 20868]